MKKTVNWVSPNWDAVRDDDACRVCGKTMEALLQMATEVFNGAKAGGNWAEAIRKAVAVRVCADCGVFTCSDKCRERGSSSVHREECPHARTLKAVAVRFLPSGGSPGARPFAIFPFVVGDGTTEIVARDAAKKFMEAFGDPELRVHWKTWDIDVYWEPAFDQSHHLVAPHDGKPETSL